MKPSLGVPLITGEPPTLGSMLSKTQQVWRHLATGPSNAGDAAGLR